MKAYLPQRHLLRALVALAASISLAPLTAQTTFTWDGNGSSDTGGNWSTAANWTSDHVPITGGDIALLGDVTAGTRTVIYDSGTTGFTSTVQFTQTTTGATNLLSIRKNFSISNAVTLAATDGTAQITVDSANAGAAVTLTASSGLTVGSNGILLLGAGSTGLLGNFTGNLTVSGGTVQAQATTNGSSVTNVITGNLTMSSGAIVIDNTVGTQGDRRITVTGDTNITGGTISSTRAGTSGMLTLTGATITFNPVSFDSDLILTLDRGGDQSITTNQTLGGGLLLRGSGVKTVTRTGGSTINSISFIDGNSSSAIGTTLKLGSDLTLASGAAQPFATNFSQTRDTNLAIQLGIDTNGFTLDLSAGAGSGVWTPANSTQNPNPVTTTVWNLSNSGAVAGGIRATAFNLSSSGSTVNVGTNVILRATGGNATASDLGSSGTFASTASFVYAGGAAAGTPATLASGRTIGGLVVESGALQITGSAFTAAGGITVNSGALLDFSTQTVAATSLTLDVSGAAFGQIKTGSVAYDFNALTFNIITTPVTGVMDLFDLGAGGAGSAPASVALSGIYGSVGLTEASGVWTGDAGGLHFSFVEASGDLTVSAIPEPSAFAALVGLFTLGLAACVRRRSRR
ncbi:MAG: hypothetical protein WC205_12675 [Opitutaceae bacterium]|jgi:hypothetical protein